MQIKTTIRYHLTFIRMAIPKKKEERKKEIASVGRDVEKRKSAYTVGGNVNWCSHCGKQNGHAAKI